jgi:aminopeptidase
MRDLRLERLAKGIVNYSVDVQYGDRVLVSMSGTDFELVSCIVEEIYKLGGCAFVELSDPKVSRTLMMNASLDQIKKLAKFDGAKMNEMDCYIGIRAVDNISEAVDIPPEQMKNYMEYYLKPVHYEKRVKNTKWCILRYPNGSMAQLANMSTEAFENFYFDVCNLDYNKMSKAMDALKDLMDKTDKVRIVSPSTDLTFSIKGIGAVKCDGKFNIPDGEVFTAPIKDSVNGTIKYNTISQYMGHTFTDVELIFRDGKIVGAESLGNSDKLNEILDTDEGSRFIGEFAIGFNPYILHPMNDILFDEKIAGSLHFTPGQAYEDADNGNRSSVHWDLVLIQREEYGGGEIWFDDVLIRKDGIFVIEELEGLNPKSLLSEEN